MTKMTFAHNLVPSESLPSERTQRGTSLRTVLIAAVLWLLFTPIPSLAIDQTLYPTGVFPTDVQNVQAALNAGGTILLKAINPSGMPTPFNFGPAVPGLGRVFIQRDVVLLGETLDSHMTTIRGGNQPIRSFVPVRIAIRGIHFDGPRGVAVLITAAIGTEIIGNKITRVISVQFPGFSKAVGILLNALSPEDISGTALIEDNVIENVDAENGDGIALVILAADTRVVGNEIRGAGQNGILVNGSARPVWIERNRVVPGPNRFGTIDFGNGIVVFNSLPLAPLAPAPVYISHNTVICDNVLADGILLFLTDGSVVTQNHVVMNDVVSGGITLYEGTSKTYVGQNRVKGAGAYALDILFVGEPQITQFNTFVGNNISSFHSTLADVFLDFPAQETVLTGNSGTVIDLGVNNHITGFSRLGAHGVPGQQIREAQQLKQQLLRTLHSVEWPVDLPE